MKYLFLFVFHIFLLSPAYAIDVIQGMGEQEAIRHAEAKIASDNNARFERMVVTLDYETGQAEKFYVTAFRDWQHANGDVVSTAEKMALNAGELVVLEGLTRMGETLHQVNVHQEIIAGINQPAGCYFCSLDIFTFSTRNNAIIATQERIAADAQAILKAMINKIPAGLIRLDQFDTEIPHIVLPYVNKNGSVTGSVVIVIKIVSGRAIAVIVQLRDHRINVLYPLKNVDKMEVDSAEHLNAIVDVLENAGYSFATIPEFTGGGGGSSGSGSVAIIDCDASQRCEKEKE